MAILRVVFLTMSGGMLCVVGLALILFEIGMARAEPPTESVIWPGILVLIALGACILYFGIWVLSRARALQIPDRPTMAKSQGMSAQPTPEREERGTENER